MTANDLLQWEKLSQTGKIRHGGEDTNPSLWAGASRLYPMAVTCLWGFAAAPIQVRQGIRRPSGGFLGFMLHLGDRFHNHGQS